MKLLQFTSQEVEIERLKTELALASESALEWNAIACTAMAEVERLKTAISDIRVYLLETIEIIEEVKNDSEAIGGGILKAGSSRR